MLNIIPSIFRFKTADASPNWLLAKTLYWPLSCCWNSEISSPIVWTLSASTEWVFLKRLLSCSDVSPCCQTIVGNGSPLSLHSKMIFPPACLMTGLPIKLGALPAGAVLKTNATKYKYTAQTKISNIYVAICYDIKLKLAILIREQTKISIKETKTNICYCK